MNMHAMNRWLTDAADDGCGADWTLDPCRHNSSYVVGVTAGQARHNSSNGGGVTAGQVLHNSRNHNSNQPERTELSLMWP